MKILDLKGTGCSHRQTRSLLVTSPCERVALVETVAHLAGLVLPMMLFGHISHRAYGATDEQKETLGTTELEAADHSKPPTVTFSSQQVSYSSQHSRNPVTPRRPASFVSSQQPSTASSQQPSTASSQWLTARTSRINSGTNSCNVVAEVYMSDEERAANL